MKNLLLFSFWFMSHALMAQKNSIPAAFLEQYPQIAQYIPKSSALDGASNRSDLTLDSIQTYSYKGSDSILIRREICDNSVPNKQSITTERIQADGVLGYSHKSTHINDQKGRLFATESRWFIDSTFILLYGFEYYWNDVSNAIDSLYVYSTTPNKTIYYNNERYYYKFNPINGSLNELRHVTLNETGTLVNTRISTITYDTSDREVLSYVVKEENGVQNPVSRRTTTYSSDTLDFVDEYYSLLDTSWVPDGHVILINYPNTQKNNKSFNYSWNKNTSSWEKASEHFRYYDSQNREIRHESYNLYNVITKTTANTTYVEDNLINSETIFFYAPNSSIEEIWRSVYFYSDSSGFHQPPILLGNPIIVKAYPNPASKSITIEADNHFIQNAEIWNTQGHFVRGFQNINNTVLQFNREALLKGIYIIRLEVEGKFVFKKIILE